MDRRIYPRRWIGEISKKEAEGREGWIEGLSERKSVI
jgi:hypothetical protein